MPENKEIINEMENFVLRVLKGGINVTQQETAILPDVLRILIDIMSDEEKIRINAKQIEEDLAVIFKERNRQK